MAYLVPARCPGESEICSVVEAQCLAANHCVQERKLSGLGFGSFQRLLQQVVHVAAVHIEVVVRTTSMAPVMDPSGYYYRVGRLKVQVEGMALATYTAKGLIVR